MSKMPNVVLIVLDTARADHLSCYGYHRETTPNIDKIASEGVLYENAISPSTWTVPSHASMFTGTFPSSHKMFGRQLKLDKRLVTLAEMLGTLDYQTVGFSSNALLGHATGLDRGFDRFKDVWYPLDGRRFSRVKKFLNRAYGRFIVRKRDQGATRLNRLVRKWLSQSYDHGKPFFMFLNYLEPHLPYRPSDSYRMLFLPDGMKWSEAKKVNQNAWQYLAGNIGMSDADFEILRALYDGGIRYLDHRIGELYQCLMKEGVLDETLLIITSDHGENIGEHELMDHQFCMYNTLLWVPLVIRYPRLFTPGQRIRNLVQTTDIFATLVDLLGVTDETITSQGQGWSLLPSKVKTRPDLAIAEDLEPETFVFERILRGDVALARFNRSLRAIISENYKYIWASDGNHELYDLIEDPQEMNNLIHALPETVRRLEKKLNVRLGSLGWIESVGEEPPEINEEVLERLRGLGYID